MREEGSGGPELRGRSGLPSGVGRGAGGAGAPSACGLLPLASTGLGFPLQRGLP